jgi:indolepyruvate ferredoxin oxidoreductase beta subunit
MSPPARHASHRSGAASQIVILGLGGQGILFVTKLLAEAAMVEGRDVITCETHGMAQRGGSVESHVKIGPFQGPLVRRGHADAVIALDPARAADAEAWTRGPRFVDSKTPLDGARCFDAAGVAKSLGASRGANIALLGFAASTAPEHFPKRESILAAIERLSPPKALEANRAAFLKGWA